MGIFIKKLNIANYRCFNKEVIHFNTPDGTNLGSGLNILIGENANGKTTILDAINFLTQSQYASENRLQINDFYDHSREIHIIAETDVFRCKLPFPYKGYFECNGFEFRAKSRKQKSKGKLLSSPFQLNSYFRPKNKTYKQQDGTDSGKDIPPLNKIYTNTNIDDDEVNIFLFDKNRTRQITTGTYKTTFERICDDLNWKFINGLNDQHIDTLIKNVCGEYFQNVLHVAQKGAGSKLSSELKEFFEDDLYENLKIELIDLLRPFSGAFFAIRDDVELKQIRTKELGSGIEMVLTLLLLRNITSQSKGSIIYLIDEPELHLHPKAQDKLVDLLINESKDKQIIVSTHSPYLFKNCLDKNIGILLLYRDQDRRISISPAKDQGWGVLPWSPSWGEINYFAYDLPTVEFHNELYGYLQDKTSKYKIMDVDNFLANGYTTKSKKWIQEKNGMPQPAKSVTVCTYNRNSIHHPENRHNAPFSEQDLRDSIEILLRAIK